MDREKPPDPPDDDLLSESSGVTMKMIAVDIPEASDFVSITSKKRKIAKPTRNSTTDYEQMNRKTPSIQNKNDSLQNNSSFLPEQQDVSTTPSNSSSIPIHPINPASPSTTLPTATTSPSQITARLYNNLDRPPYITHVTKMSNDGKPSNLYDVDFGHFMFKNKIHPVWNGVKSVGRNRLSVEFKTAAEANSFVKSDVAKKNYYNIFIPTYQVTKLGVTKGIPPHWSIEDILENITVPHGFGKVTKARRLNYRFNTGNSIEWRPSQSVVLTFDSKDLPQNVTMFNVSLPVELYVFPTVQCYKCCRFGHTKNLCRSEPRCFKCSSSHSGDSCDKAEENYKCLNCSGNHMSISKICPELSRQRNIKHTMAEKSISYAEASRMFNKSIPSYSEITSKNSKNSKNSTPSQPSSLSFRKTVEKVAKPRVQTKKNNANHESLLWFPNGQLPSSSDFNAYPKPSNKEHNYSTDLNSTLITSFLHILQTLNKNNIQIPSHVAKQITNIINTTRNGSSDEDSSVELS